MQVPLRLLRAIRPSEHPGLLLATAYGTAVLSVAPFLLPALAAEYDIELSLASAATAVQLAGFSAGSWSAGRYLHPRGRVLGIALAGAVVANGLSALLPTFGALLVLRALSGVTLGVITWFSWSLVFGDEERMGSIAVVGPLVGITTAPVAAQLLESFGPEAIFAALAVTAVVPLAVARRSGSDHDTLLQPRAPRSGRGRHTPTPEASRILVGLGLLTLGGSAVFTYGAVIGVERTGLSLSAVSLAYSANAVASIPSARWSGQRRAPGAWLGGCALCAATMGVATAPAVFVTAITAWGFLFWLGVPGAYAVLSRSSRHPAERAGDAQAVMAGGRVLGPLAGGAILDLASPPVLGLAGATVMAAGAMLIAIVDRRSRRAPELPQGR